MSAPRALAAVVIVAAVLGAPHGERGPSPRAAASRRAALFVMFSANAPRAAPQLFARYVSDRDYVRIESLPDDVRVPRARRFALPTTTRARFLGDPGVRHWVERGCGPSTPGTIVYDPERRRLTPAREQRDVGAAIRRATRLVSSTGCHAFGLAPGAALLFGLDARACSYDLGAGLLEHISWTAVDVVDIQAQRLLGDHCVARGGVATYAAAVRAVTSYVRRRNPSISVASQVSFRDNAPVAMRTGIDSVATVVDGIYFSYPSTHPSIACRYCTRANLQGLLQYLRGRP